MICEKCGKENQENANFCRYCGNPLQKNLNELIQRARENDQSALTEIYRYSSPEVLRTIEILIRDGDTVKDILQDTYIKAFTRLDQLQNPDRLVPWIKTIANNTAKDWLKKSKPMLFSDISAGRESGELPFEEKIKYENMQLDPEIEIDSKEVSRLVMEILDQLPEDQRMVIGMFYYEEMPVRNIAAVLGVSENTVKSRLAYGRKKIKEQVLDLEKRGTKLYTMAPFVFFLYLLHRTQNVQADASEMAALQSVMESGIYPAGQYNAPSGFETAKKQADFSDIAGTAGRSAASASKAAAGTVAKTAAKHTGVKIASIILAGSLSIGGVTYGLIKNADRLPFELPFTEKHMTVVHKDAVPEHLEDYDDTEESEEPTDMPEQEVEITPETAAENTPEPEEEITPEPTPEPSPEMESATEVSGPESGYYMTILNPNASNGQGGYYMGRTNAVEHDDNSITFYGNFSMTDELPFTYSADQCLEDAKRTFQLTPETQYYYAEIDGNYPASKEDAMTTCERLNGLAVTLKVTDGKIDTMTFSS